MSELLARVALSRVHEAGTSAVWSYVQQHGAAAAWDAVRRGRPMPGLSEERVAGAVARAAGYDPQRDLDAVHRLGARVVCPGDDEWPEGRLSWPADTGPHAPPLLLYARGALDVATTTERSVAVVGARAATVYGSHVAEELARGLVDRSCSVVSGAAYGIDAAAHGGALLSAGPATTVAVLACGVDVPYPRGNDRLLAEIAERGLVLSELPPGCPPTRPRFLVRNRVIAALSLGTVVVEAAVRSGSLATAARARDLHRHVMAVPGPVTSQMSAGAHLELRRPGTVCVTSAADVLDTVGRLGTDVAEPSRGPEHPRDTLHETARQVLEAVPVRGSFSEARIARTAGISGLVVQRILPPLMVAGLVQRIDGGWRLTPLGAGRPAPEAVGRRRAQ